MQAQVGVFDKKIKKDVLELTDCLNEPNKMRGDALTANVARLHQAEDGNGEEEQDRDHEENPKFSGFEKG